MLKSIVRSCSSDSHSFVLFPNLSVNLLFPRLGKDFRIYFRDSKDGQDGTMYLYQPQGCICSVDFWIFFSGILSFHSFLWA